MKGFEIFHNNSKSQSSTELLITLAIGFTIILIIGGIFFNYSVSAKNTLDKKQIEKIGNELITNIEKIYFLGNGNRLTYETEFPELIYNFTIVHLNNTNSTDDIVLDYFNIAYQDENTISSSIFFTNEFFIRFNCTNSCYKSGNISYYNETSIGGGNKRIRIESKGKYVNVDFVRN